MISVCERCNSQFKADTEQAIKTAFEAHKCKPADSSQNALHIVQEAPKISNLFTVWHLFLHR
jgi:hypothetical protein